MSMQNDEAYDQAHPSGTDYSYQGGCQPMGLCDNAGAAIGSIPIYSPGTPANTMSVLTGNFGDGGSPHPLDAD